MCNYIYIYVIKCICNYMYIYIYYVFSLGAVLRLPSLKQPHVGPVDGKSQNNHNLIGNEENYDEPARDLWYLGLSENGVIAIK